MNSRVLKSIFWMLVVAFAAWLPVSISAQNPTKTVADTSKFDSPSKWDIFLGYSYLAPKKTVAGTSIDDIEEGGIASISRYFTRNLGVQFEGDVHSPSENGPADADFSGGSGGLIYRYPTAKITPFLHLLVGGERVGSYSLLDNWGPVVTAGGGLDWNIGPRMAIRFVQADYQFTHESYGSAVAGSESFNSLRLSAGVVFSIGTITPPPPVTIACSASPTSIFPGDPVSVTATAGDVNPKLNAIYSWSGEGVTGSGTSASVATGLLAPGTHTVKCGVKEGKPGKEGLKPGQSAESSTSFTVKAFEPPTISCAADPATIKPGDSVTITASAVSPQNRPLTYSYTATAGAISGSGTTAQYTSAGAPTGAVGITCSVADDKDHTATASTTVTILAPPPPPPQPHVQALCSIGFANDKKRLTRVDNEAKACLDQVALDLKQNTDAKAVVVGESTADEKATTAKEEAKAAKYKHSKVTVEHFAEQRAVNTKDYLVTDQGIDASRISVMTGTSDGQTVENYVVPSGANFAADVPGKMPVDETQVKPEVRKPLPERKHSTKKAK